MTLEARLGATVGGLRIEADLVASSGEVVALLGPNGAGKTTVLRALGGLVPLEEGRVVLDGEVLEDVEAGVRVPTERRPVGFVFQDYLLFPHLSVLENVAFGLRARGTGRDEARVRAREWLERMGLGERARSKPGALSGGEAQRVALARALATDPALLLLDEPLAALDASARLEMRRDLRRHLASFDGIRLLVTHDPLEAMTLSDRIVILEEGRVVQSGSSQDILERPRSRYVADLVGRNLFRGRSDGGLVMLDQGVSLTAAGSQPAGSERGEVFASVHPHSVALHRRHPEGTPRNVWSGRIAGLDPEGDRVRVKVEGSIPIVAEVTPASVEELRLADGGEVWVSVKATEIDVYPA